MDWISRFNAKARADWAARNARLARYGLQPISGPKQGYAGGDKIGPKGAHTGIDYTGVYGHDFGYDFTQEPAIPHNWGIGDADLFDHLDPETRELVREAIAMEDFANDDTLMDWAA